MTQSNRGDQPPDVPSLLQVLGAHNVRYVLTGSVAAQLYGIEVQPGDLDITPALDQENLTRLAKVLVEIEAGLPDTDEVGQWEVQPDGEKKWISRPATAEDLQQRAKWFPDAKDLSTLDHLFHTRYGNFDVVPGLADNYEVLVKGATRLNAHGQQVWVAHVDELLAALTVPRRKKDGPRVRQLREIQRRRAEGIGLQRRAAMQIVTDSGTDVCLSHEQAAELNIHIVPLVVTLDGKSYREGVDIQPADFYRLLAATDSLPTTSQPSAGDFAETYRRLAATDPDILSIHVTSGLSGTFNAAQTGAKLVPEANITALDTKTLSAAAGWQVEAAARAQKAGWPKEQILSLMERIGAASDSMYTLKELKYLIHGGRISHMKGLIASVLNLKPLIGVEKVNGTYVQLGQARAFKGAVKGLVDLIARQHEPGSALRVQVLHSQNPEGAAMLRDLVDRQFECTWLPLGPMSLVLGAHTGPSMVGVAFAPLATFADVP